MNQWEADGQTRRLNVIYQNLKPIKETLTTKYQHRHNKYHHILLTKKVQCYEKKQLQDQLITSQQKPEINPFFDLQASKIPASEDTILKYYECFEKIENFQQNNFDKLSGECNILNNKLDNCVSQCSSKSTTNEAFEKCAFSENGCFKKYEKLVNNLYSSMYKVILGE